MCKSYLPLRPFILLFIVYLISLPTSAQDIDSSGSAFRAAATSVTLTGRVVGPQGTPVRGALTTLHRLDSSLVKGDATDEDGQFRLVFGQMSAYRVRISHLGYSEQWRTITSTDTIKRIVITLQPATIKLAEVSVKQKRPPFEVAADRVVLNLEDNPVFAGVSTLDALRLAPRLAVDPLTKALTVDGKAGVILYQNGRQSYQTPDQIIVYLQNLPANAINRIEVLTNPSAGYDANGNAVILLYTRTTANTGLSGQSAMTAGVGRYPKVNATLSLNWRNAKLQGDLTYTPLSRPTYFEHQFQQQLAGTDPALNQTGFARSYQFRRINTRSHTLRTALNWQVGSKTTIGTVWQGTQTVEKEIPKSTIIYRLADPNAVLTQQDATANFNRQLENFSGNVNLRQQLNNPENSLSVDLDVAHYSNVSQSSAIVYSVIPQLEPAQMVSVHSPNTVRFQTIKLDYTGTSANKGRWESGLKHSHIAMSNRPELNYASKGFIELAYLLAQPYEYKERTTSGYATYSDERSDWSWQAGIRVERTYYQGYANNNVSIRRLYTNLFPSVTFQRTTSRKGQISLSANRRIVRPAFEALNPTYVFYSPISFFRGNPLLVPQLTTTAQATYTTKRRSSLTAVYSQSHDRITEVVYRLDSITPTVVNTLINFDREQRVALTATLPLKLTTTWQMQAIVTGSRVLFSSTFGGSTTKVSQTGASVRLVNTIKLKQWTGNVALSARTAAVIGYFRYPPLWYLDMGIQRPLGEKSTLKLSATDIFHSILPKNYGRYLTTDIAYQHQYESQQVLLTYAYKFGNEKMKADNPRTVGSEAEQDRIRRRDAN